MLANCPHCGKPIDPHMFGWWGLRKKKGPKTHDYMSALANKRNQAMKDRMGPEAYSVYMRDIANKRWHTAVQE